jgi:nucleoside-diphosphate-sugar epimerase
MKVLVTGASGFIGQYVLKLLHSNCIDTVLMGRRKPTVNTQLNFIEVDLLNAPNLEELVRSVGATHLLHLAWFTEHGKFWKSPLNLKWVQATERLAKAFCSAGGEKIIATGTCAEYEWTDDYCDEEMSSLKSDTPYGVSKNETQRLLKIICLQHQVSFAWARVFFPYGKGEDRQRLIPSLIQFFRHERLPFGVNLDVQRDFLHASDVADGLMSLLLSNADGCYNICSGEPAKLAYVVQELARFLDGDPQPILNLQSSRSGEPIFLAGKNSKLQGLGWKQKLSLEDGLRKTVNEIRYDFG